MNTFMTNDFKEFLENKIYSKANFEESSQLMGRLETEYENNFIILDCLISYNYIQDGSNGYDEPNQSGYEIDGIEFLNLTIYNNEGAELNKKEINKIINFLNNEPKPIKISGVKTKEILTRLITTEFYKFSEPWQTLLQIKLIETAKQYGLTELAEELTKDLE